MPRKIDFETVLRMALKLPEVEESTIHGRPSLKLRGKLLACIPVHRSAEPDSLVVRIDLERRARLLDESPETYYLTDHYVNYPMLLVRLRHIDSNELKELLKTAWRGVAGPAKGRKPRTRGK